MIVPTLEQQVTHLEAELERINRLLQVDPTVQLKLAQLNQADRHTEAHSNDLSFGVFANDPYFDEIIQRMREERELDADNPAYTAISS